MTFVERDPLVHVLDPSDGGRHAGHAWAGRSLHLAQAEEIAAAIREAGYMTEAEWESERGQADERVYLLRDIWAALPEEGDAYGIPVLMAERASLFNQDALASTPEGSKR